MHNILITGAAGQLGSELKCLSSNYNYNYFFTVKNTLNILNKKELEYFLQTNNITYIINCAAYTAVDNAENNHKHANNVNHLAVKNLALIAKKLNISLIHISTDYVFDGKNYLPYQENDNTNPNNIYGRTKLDGENAIIKINPTNTIIIRTSWLYSNFGANFLQTMLNLSKKSNTLNIVYDQIGCPTYAKDLATVILNILPKINNKKVQIYHYANEGIITWYDFAKAIFEILNIAIKINPIITKDHPTIAIRPYYSALNKAKIKNDFNIVIPYWKDSLKKCLNTTNEK